MIRVFSLKRNLIMTFDIFSNLGNFFRKGMIYGVIFSLSFPHFAWATEAVIELDFKDSQTPQRLHVIPRLSNVADVSHVEIDTEQQQVVVHRLRKPEDALSEQSAAVVSLPPSPVMIQNHDIINLLWDLEPEQFIMTPKI